MKGKFEILMVIAVLCLPGVMSGETGPFFGRVDYAVSLPMAEDDVVYHLTLAAHSNPADSLLGESYLIQWEGAAPSADTGFTAYFNGHFYNFRSDRLREYHYQWDSIPFLTASGGVQRNAQFLSLFPFSIEKQLREMAVDSTFTLEETISGNVKKVNGKRIINGAESLQFELQTDAATGRPLRLEQLFNPGMLGEQEVVASYRYDSIDSLFLPTSEEELIALFPEAFERFRTSNYSVENLRGLPLPTIALPTVSRERYLHNKGDRFATPMILALLDPEVASTPETIRAMREAVGMLPRQTGLIFAFVNNDIDRIEQLVGTSMIGERTLTSARTLARDSGVNSFPTLILVNSDGTVAEVILGYGADLREQLLQKSALLK